MDSIKHALPAPQSNRLANISLNLGMAILVVDDDPAFNDLVCNFLRRQGYETMAAYSTGKALEAVAQSLPELVISDYQLPDKDGLYLLGQLKARHPQLPVVLITTYSDVRLAVNSMKLGALEFVTKPVVPDELLKVVRTALHAQPQAAPEKKSGLSTNYVIGNNPQMKLLWEHLQLVAPTRMNVLILGESGTGKEHLARQIHALSHRKNAPFVSIDCGAIPPELAASELFGHTKGAFTGAMHDKQGLLQAAHGGTLFLDELGNLSADVQAMLLRALQEGSIKPVGSTKEVQIDVRILAATNEKLRSKQETSGFRNDLFHRLNEFSLHVPPLRERFDDLEAYCAFFIEEAARDLGKETPDLSPGSLAALRVYEWPGNLRELRNLLRRAVLLSQNNLLDESMLPNEFKGSVQPASPEQSHSAFDLKSTAQQTEREMIVQALENFKFNKSKAAKALNIDRSTLYAKIKAYGIEG